MLGAPGAVVEEAAVRGIQQSRGLDMHVHICSELQPLRFQSQLTRTYTIDRRIMAPSDFDAASSVFPETIGKAKSNKRLVGRKVLIVGAGQRQIVDADPPIGNGRAIATLFAREGAAVVCLDVIREAAEATVQQIRSEGGEAYPYIFDVRDASGIPKAVADAKATLGGLDGLVLVVGISRGLPLHKITRESWDDEFAVNVRSHMLFAQSSLQTLDPGASIVILSSMAGLRANSGNPAYETSKAAQMALVRAVARAGEPQGVRANVIAPGYVDTPLGRDASRHRKGRAARVPFGRQATGWEVAYLALFLMSREASYISGQTINIDAGSLSGTDGRPMRLMGWGKL
ncbi:NAD(P)-binding protein [Trichodelitschia bisporula]|uniref:NAD(P)-binding protein n=1 Tax=Trichodelitschia bisporula TaxID=703511 RepID=A0A6G1I7K8_9PEZI|nr:NAD(P)-binding protein [Trichodelitschia bisporula]